MTRSFSVILLTAILSVGAVVGDDELSNLESFFESHCVECHDDDVSKGGLNLYNVDPGSISGISDVGQWTHIFDRVKNGEMPPEKKRGDLSAEDVALFLETLAPRLDKADRELREVVQRRLNRIEYEHTIQDLLGIDIELKQHLPPDQKAGGFDNNGAALAISSELIESYLKTARIALDAALIDGPRPETESIINTLAEEPKPYFGKQYGYHDGFVFSYLTDRQSYSKISTRKTRITKPGRYRFRFSAVARNTERKEVFSVMKSGPESADQILGYFEVGTRPEPFELETRLAPNESIQFFALGLPTWGKDPDLNGFTGIGFSEVEITGPLAEEWPPPSHRNLVGTIDLATLSDDQARNILRKLATGAFRRPVTDPELLRYTALFERQKQSGLSAGESLRTAMEAILCSTNFLTLSETGGDGFISDYELASRLSYFIRSSGPDKQLLDLAESGTLSAPGRIEQELDRLLNNPKSERFIKHFTGQWLGLRKINETTPDSNLYKEFDELLQTAMVEEGESFFRKVLHDDLPVRNFLDSDFIIANERLAEHYGISGVSGLAMRPVPLPPGSVRGGLLTQAGILKVTANGTNTSPVLRGVWVLENILGHHVPPPPPNIAGIEPDIREATTVREQLDLHRNNESCRSCHQYIDPPGFALESFDPIGGFRENYLQFIPTPGKSWGKVIQAKEVDASGELSSGETFKEIREFKALLLKDEERFLRCLTDRLLTYGLGRELGFSDRQAVETLVEQAQNRGGGLKTLLKLIVGSDLFRTP
ncbi:MAG: DUF1592 domain-containing protein [Verrucomicrobiales bacterium]|nr:DUF1592 domain-containing protein [Verrucomicrobiales bacterium]